MTDEYWKPWLFLSSSTESRSGAQSFLVASNVGGRGDLYLSFSSEVKFITLCCGRNLTTINAMYLVWSRTMELLWIWFNHACRYQCASPINSQSKHFLIWDSKSAFKAGILEKYNWSSTALMRNIKVSSFLKILIDPHAGHLKNPKSLIRKSERVSSQLRALSVLP